MKRWMWMLVILFACGVANAQDSVMVAKKKSGTTCDSCSGDLALAHHFEDATCDDNTKSVCGCSDNASKDLTLGTGGGIDAAISATTGTGWPSDGSYSLAVGTNDTTIPITWDKSQGTITFDVYCSTWGARSRFIHIGNAENDALWVLASGSDDGSKAHFYYRSNSGTFHVASLPNNSFTGPKTSFTVKWDANTAHSGHYLHIYVGGTPAYYDTAITALNGTYTALDINNTPTTTNVCYIDNLKVYTSWQ